ncbi:MAG: glycosyltransferase family 4 protein [Gemmiger sp.]
MNNYAVDGLFLAQRLSGIQRYSMELLAAYDELAGSGRVEVVVPASLPEEKRPRYNNLRVVPYGRHSGFAWEQLDYPRYLKESGRKGLCLCNVIPVHGFSGTAVVHDICYKARPDFYTAPRDRASAAWHCLQYRLIAEKADRIITVSEFSKRELMRVYGVPESGITVIYNAWQQMQRVQPDNRILQKSGLQRGRFYFSMANLLKNKNFPWVLRAAQNSPGETFAIAGGGSLEKAAGEMGLAGLPNVKYLGYVTDGEAKALMAGCKAFLFPTFYEGFGIPPLEAIACGAPRILVSDTPCMREVYGPYACYIDLDTNTGDVNAVTPGAQADNPAGILERYSWQESARRLAALLDS